MQWLLIILYQENCKQKTSTFHQQLNSQFLITDYWLLRGLAHVHM